MDLRAKELPKHLEDQLTWDDYPVELMKAPCDGRFRTVRAKYEDATMSGKTKGKEAYKDLWTAILRSSNSDGWGEFDIGSSLHHLPREVPRIDRDPNLRRYSFKLEKIACRSRVSTGDKLRRRSNRGWKRSRRGWSTLRTWTEPTGQREMFLADL